MFLVVEVHNQIIRADQLILMFYQIYTIFKLDSIIVTGINPPLRINQDLRDGICAVRFQGFFRFLVELNLLKRTENIM